MEDENESLEQMLIRLDKIKPGKTSRITKGTLVPMYLFEVLHKEDKTSNQGYLNRYNDALYIEMFKSIVWGATIGGSIVSFFYH